MQFAEAKHLVTTRFSLQETNPGVYDGAWHEDPDGQILECFSPVNGASLGRVSAAGASDLARVSETSLAAAARWADVPAPMRGEIIAEIGKELAACKRELGLLVSLEAGKTLSEGQGEVQEMIDLAGFAAGLSRQLYGLTIASERPHHRMYEQWHPLGVVAVVTSFNFPCAVWSWNAFIAAVVGDAVIWKPSSRTPLVAVAVTRVAARVLERHSLPPIFSLLVGGGPEIGTMLLEDRRLPLVSFTGSVATGKKVAEIVGRRVGRALLELGGNNGVIVSDKADLDVALKGVAFGALATAGQRCTSTRRLLLHESVYDRFLERLVRAYEHASVGDPLLAETLVGPLIDEGAAETYLEATRRAVGQGGRLVFGGGRATVPGCEGGHYVVPAIIEADPGMDVVREETFGPLLYVMRYRDIEEACRLHNDVPQGLSSAIFTTDLREEEYFLSHRGSDCGLANVNTSTAGAEIGGAFGGEKETGGGRESGSDAWKAYARRQTVSINHGADLALAQGVRFDI